MRVLLTGAAGLVGRAAVNVLGERHQVTCLDIRPVPGVPAAVRLDVLDLPALVAAVAGHDALVNTIMAPNPAYADGGPGFTVNVTGMFHLLEAARRNGIRRFVHTSSGAVHAGYPQGTRLTHDLYPLKAAGPYSLSKVLQEHLAWTYHELHGLEVVCLRPWDIIDAERMVTTDGTPVRRIVFGTIDRYDVATALRAALEVPELGYECLYLMATRGGYARTDAAHTEQRLGWKPARWFVEDA